jgi:hypothetical protein
LCRHGRLLKANRKTFCLHEQAQQGFTGIVQTGAHEPPGHGA